MGIRLKVGATSKVLRRGCMVRARIMIGMGSKMATLRVTDRFRNTVKARGNAPRRASLRCHVTT